MDLFVLGTIVVVFLVLLGASLLVNKMPSGKTFEEVQQEKKQLADQMKQHSRPAKPKGATNNNGASNKGKEKKGKKPPAKTQSVKQEEEDPAEGSHVEFVEEPVYLSEDLPVSTSSTGLNKPQRQPAKKGKAKGQGILVNKGEQSVTKPAAAAVQPVLVVEEQNHFEEIHPKDDIEMLKSQVGINYDRWCHIEFMANECLSLQIYLCRRRNRPAVEVESPIRTR